MYVVLRRALSLSLSPSAVWCRGIGVLLAFTHTHTQTNARVQFPQARALCSIPLTMIGPVGRNAQRQRQRQTKCIFMLFPTRALRVLFVEPGQFALAPTTRQHSPINNHNDMPLRMAGCTPGDRFGRGVGGETRVTGKLR